MRGTQVASLERDLELLPDAERTVLGEHGTTLSGGQQHRVNIARAVHRRRLGLVSIR